MSYKVERVEGCISCGICVSECHDNWEMKEDEEGKMIAFPIKDTINEEELECNMNAAKSCPATVIHIKKETGEKVFPE